MSDQDTINKVVFVGSYDEFMDRGSGQVRVFVSIKFDGERLSLTGVEGPKANGDARGGCGQIHMSWTDEYLEELASGDLDRRQVRKLRDVWKRWHLNDLRAGTPAQMEHMRGLTFPGYPVDHYTWTKDELTSAGLQPDPETGYSYGSAWLFEEVPAEVIDWLASLPVSSVPYHWA